MINLTCPEIQLPTFETCKKLKELGVMPPLSYIDLHKSCAAYIQNFHQTLCVYGSFGEDYCFFTQHLGTPYKDAVFAPDLGQLIALYLQTWDMRDLMVEIEYAIDKNKVIVEQIAELIIHCLTAND